MYKKIQINFKNGKTNRLIANNGDYQLCNEQWTPLSALFTMNDTHDIINEFMRGGHDNIASIEVWFADDHSKVITFDSDRLTEQFGLEL